MRLLLIVLLLVGVGLLAGTAFASNEEQMQSQEKSLLIKGRIHRFDTGENNRLPRPKHHARAVPLLHNPACNSADLGIDKEWLKSFHDIKKNAEKAKPAPLGESELQRLSKYDISILLDRSGSMNEELDRFQMGGRVSRWEWCRQQAESLSKQIASVFPSGITVLPFSNHADRYTNVSAAGLNRIFIATEPEGSTMLDEAVGLELDHFLFNRSTGRSKKPLLMVVITDGSPNDPQKVVDEILHVSRKIERDEVKIVFFMIGDDPMSLAFIDYIKSSRIEAGIAFDIVSSHPFPELRAHGLARSLANALEAPVARVAEHSR